MPDSARTSLQRRHHVTAADAMVIDYKDFLPL
jgi:hypothetical protein